MFSFALNRLAYDQLRRCFVLVQFFIAFDVVIEVDGIFMPNLNEFGIGVDAA
jgi:hypothetical protein